MIIKDIPQSGKRGLYVSQRGRFALISRILATPRNPRTSAQSTVRANLAAVTKNWKTLTEAERQGWIAGAKLVQALPTLGQTNDLTGNQLFTKVNCSLLAIGAPIVSDCPAIPAVEPLPVDALDITNTAGVVAIKLHTTAAPPDGTMLRAAPPQSAGRYAVPEMVLLGTLDSPGQDGSVDITGMYTARFGAPVSGQKLFVSVNQNILGYQSVPVTFTGIVPAGA